MKKFLFIAIAVLTTLGFAACSQPGPAASGGGYALTQDDGTFMISIYTDKEVYSKDEPVICRAKVEYVGDSDSIVIYSGDPLVGFALKDGRYFNGDYAVSHILISTEFKKGVPVTYDFVKSGGWSGDDPNAEFYKRFYSEKQLILPPGEYVISATIDGFFDKDDYESSKYKLSASASIKVE